MSDEMIVVGVVKKESKATRIWEAVYAGAIIGIILSLFAMGTILGFLAIPIGMLICGGIQTWREVKKSSQKTLAASADKERIKWLLAVRGNLDSEIDKLGNTRHQLDRELAALTSDDFVEEFVRDKPFPAPPPLVPLLTPSIPDVSDEPDPDFSCWRIDSDCA